MKGISVIHASMKDMSPRAVRMRLMHPANAVYDAGIDLRRRCPLEPPPPLPEPPAELPELPTRRPTPRRELHYVVGAVADYYKVPRCEVYGESRLPRFVIPRHICCFIGREFLHHRIKSIAYDLNYIDHTTVLFAIKKVAWRMRDNAAFCADVVDILHQCNFEVWHV